MALEARLCAGIPDHRRVLKCPRLRSGDTFMVAAVAEQLDVAVGALCVGEATVLEAGRMRVLEVRRVRNLDPVAVDAELRLDTALTVAVRAGLGPLVVRDRVVRRRVDVHARREVRGLM